MLQLACESDHLMFIFILFLLFSLQFVDLVVVSRAKLEVDWIPRNVDLVLKQENMELDCRCLALKDALVVILFFV